MVTNALVKQWEYTIGMCDNFWCSRIGLLETMYANGEPAACLCVGGCLDCEDANEFDED